MLKFAGFPVSAWAFALRTWAAMMLGLYVAFWLQLENAYFAAVTGTEMTTPCSGTPTASGNWPRCSQPMAMSVVTI